MLSDIKIIAVYCLIDDVLKGIGYREDVRRRIIDSEVLTTAIVSALYFGGHMDNARNFMRMTGMVPQMLDKSRFCRRLHDLESLFFSMFLQICEHVKQVMGAGEYVIDSFPVAVCDNIRIRRSKIVKGEQWRGKQCSMRRYFYRVKVEVLTTAGGIPVEFSFIPASESDVQALKKLPIHVAPESNVYADSAYTDYGIEDDMKEAEAINLMIQRKSNAKKKDEPWIRYIKETMRKRIETVFSGLKALFLRKIHAVTFKGFLLKLVIFLTGYTLNKLTD